MAFREEMSPQDLRKVRVLINKISSPKRYEEIVPGSSFQIADNALALFRDVKHLFLDRNPQFSGWKSWGPGYYHDFAPPDGEPLQNTS